MFIFDSHLHFFSYDFFRALVRQKDANADVDRVLAELATKNRIEIPSREVGEHTKKWVAELERHSVSRAVAFASVPEEIAAVDEAIRHSNGKLVGFFLTNPKSEGSSHRVHQCGNMMNFRGVMLFPALHHYHVNDESLLPFFEAVSECKLNVLVHFGILQIKLRDYLGLPRLYDSRYANPLSLHAVANRFRHLHFIIPHFGCGFLRETLMLGMQCENVFVDTSSSNNWMITQPYALDLVEVFRRVKNVYGAERMLFGTDSGVFPRGWRKDIYEVQNHAMQKAGFSTEELELVFGGNTKLLMEG